MEIMMRKFGNPVGAIFPPKLNAVPGDEYKIVKLGDTLVMTPLRNNLFANETDWTGFRDSVSQEDNEWDEIDD